MTPSSGIIKPATPAEIAIVRDLFREYWDSFGFTPCFQNFGDELAGLPGKYAPPEGRLALARVDRVVVGCIALRPIDDARCEMKRLYVRPQGRRRGVGKALVEWLIAEARAQGYRELLCDTMPAMRDARAMYDRMGFERIAPYDACPTEGAIYLRLPL